MHFSLSKLFLALALTGLACAGMLSPTNWWATSITSLTIALFTLVAIRAIGLQGRERVFAIMFSLVGSGYLLLVISHASETLITNYPLALLADARHIDPSQPKFTPTNAAAFSWTTLMSNDGTPIMGFFRIGHCIWSWLLALVAGWFAGYSFEKTKRLQRP
jgi:hypothetical protein